MTYRMLRRFAFRMDPERAHHLALRAARLAGTAGRLAGAVREAGPVEVFGLRFLNPVGLAAGYDKDAVAWRGLAALGVGHIEVGTVTPRPQSGNPTPSTSSVMVVVAGGNGLTRQKAGSYASSCWTTERPSTTPSSTDDFGGESCKPSTSRTQTRCC